MFKNKYYWAYIFNRGTALSFSHLVSIYWMSHVLGIVLGLQWRRHSALSGVNTSWGKRIINRIVLGSG